MSLYDQINGNMALYALELEYREGRVDVGYAVSALRKAGINVMGVAESKRAIISGTVSGKEPVFIFIRSDARPDITRVRYELESYGVIDFTLYALDELRVSDLAVMQEHVRRRPRPVPVGGGWYEIPLQSLDQYLVLVQVIIPNVKADQITEDAREAVSGRQVSGWYYVPYEESIHGVLLRIFTSDTSDLRAIADILDARYDGTIVYGIYKAIPLKAEAAP